MIEHRPALDSENAWEFLAGEVYVGRLVWVHDYEAREATGWFLERSGELEWLPVDGDVDALVEDRASAQAEWHERARMVALLTANRAIAVARERLVED